MANGKAWFGRTFGKYFFDETTVASVDTLGPRFRKLTLEGDVVATARWSAGDKVQVFVGDEGMRTYTLGRRVASGSIEQATEHIYPGAMTPSVARPLCVCSARR